MLTPEEALTVGLVDELAPPADVVDRALAWAREVVRLPAAAVADTRAIARADLVELVRTAGLESVPSPADHWWDPETQAALKALVQRLKK